MTEDFTKERLSHRERESQRRRDSTLKIQDASRECPSFGNLCRKEEFRYDLIGFLYRHFISDYTKPLPQYRIDALLEMQDMILNGGEGIDIRPRGDGKTFDAKRVAMWALLYGHKEYLAIIAATDDLAKTFLEAIKITIPNNETLYHDFTRTVHAIKAVETSPGRQNGQTWKDIPTHIRWRAEILRFPLIKGEDSYGVICNAFGLGSAFRGLNITIPGKGDIRPDMLLLDDPQTDESAKSDEQCDDRYKKIIGTARGLKGQRKPLTIRALSTIIKENDLSCRLRKHWHGKIIPMLYTMPDNMKLWEAYWEIRENAKEAGKTDMESMFEARDFYEKNREEMDKGAEASWNERHWPASKEEQNKPQPIISAIQQGMIEYFNDPPTFFSEYQNAPQEEENEEIIRLKFDDMKRRISEYPRMVVPEWAVRMTAFIDPGDHVLWYTMWAYADGFRRSHCVDYGTFPPQNESYYSKESILKGGNTLSRRFPGQSVPAAIIKGLDELVAYLTNTDNWSFPGGVPLPKGMLCKIGIDMGDGEHTAAIRDYCTRSQSDILIPTKGDNRVFELCEQVRRGNIQRRTGELFGTLPWIENTDIRKGKFLRFDANWWKTNFAAAAMQEQGDVGEISIFKNSVFRHRLFLEHLGSEFGKRKKNNRGYVETVWDVRKSAIGNDFWDPSVECRMLLSYAGVHMQDYQPTTKPKNNSLASFADMQKDAIKNQGNQDFGIDYHFDYGGFY